MSDETLLGALRSRGAVIAEIHGRATAASFGDAASEYRALRESAAIVDLPWLGALHVTGSDRVTFLQGMLSNDVAKLATGTGCPALLLSEQGKAIADMLVLATAEEIVLVGVAAALVAAQAALERFIVADDVEIAPPNESEHTFGILGPAAADVLGRLGVTAIPQAVCEHVRTEVGGTTLGERAAVTIVRVSTAGMMGFLCQVAADAAGWWERCVSAGALPAGSEAADVLRIESGLPWHGRDVTAETLALEAPYDAAISFSKGCYLGQEVMERVTARGHVNRKLVGLEIEGEDVPPAGTRLFADGKDVGWVSSVARSWRHGRVIALAYVRREHFAPGTPLFLGDGAGVAATVHALPF